MELAYHIGFTKKYCVIPLDVVSLITFAMKLVPMISATEIRLKRESRENREQFPLL